MDQTTPRVSIGIRETDRRWQDRWQFHGGIGLLLGVILGLAFAAPAGRIVTYLTSALPWSANTNLVADGSFAHLDSWNFVVRPGSSAAFRQDGGQHINANESLKIDESLAAPANPWYVQVLQGDIPLRKGNTFRLTFYAKGDVGTSMEPTLQQDVTPFALYFDRTVALTNTWHQYSYTFTSSVTDPHTNLTFNLARAAGLMWLDDVSLTVTTPGSSTGSAVATLIPAATPTAQSSMVPAMTGWNMVWDDEFDGARIDSSRWNVASNAPGGYQNDSLGDGLQAWSPQAVSVQDGDLRISSTRQQVDGHDYMSGALTTQDKFSFLYGRIDIRARLPKGDGLWPAIWLLPEHDTLTTTASFETDMLELLGQDPTTAYVVEHTVGYERSFCTYLGPDFSAGFHIFTLEWTPGKLLWFVDGAPHCTITTGVPNIPMYLLLNTYVGGSWPGPPDSTTVFPQYTNFDYVRFYSQVNGQSGK